MYLYDSVGRRHKASHLAWIEQVCKLKDKSGSNPWPVIEECLNFWASQNPMRYKSFLIDVDETRQTRKDRKFGSSYHKETNSTLRYTLDIPQEVILMIRCIYTANQLPMNRDFYQEFARKFPKMKVAEKL